MACGRARISILESGWITSLMASESMSGAMGTTTRESGSTASGMGRAQISSPLETST